MAFLQRNLHRIHACIGITLPLLLCIGLIFFYPFISDAIIDEFAFTRGVDEKVSTLFSQMSFFLAFAFVLLILAFVFLFLRTKKALFALLHLLSYFSFFLILLVASVFFYSEMIDYAGYRMNGSDDYIFAIFFLLLPMLFLIGLALVTPIFHRPKPTSSSLRSAKPMF